MSFPSVNPTHTKAWSALEKHFHDVKHLHMKMLFLNNEKRAEEFSISWDDFLVDYSKNRITKDTLSLLLGLAEEVKLKEAITAYFAGEKINKTEDRAVLHTALRCKSDCSIFVDGVNIIPEIQHVKQRIKTFTSAVISGKQKGITGKAFTDIVNIGIGGSDLGPAMVVEALQYYKNHLNSHFVNNIDGDHVNTVLKTLNPETTLFIVVSKSFTTQETLSNALTIKEWFLSHGFKNEAISKHFVAVSTNIKAVKAFGISEANMFPMWNWVGGRFSLWSAVGLSISLAIGYAYFEDLLDGAFKMDTHFKTSSLENNIPVILALISIWYNNFFKAETQAVIAYSQYLNKLPLYLQQAVMESNGKSIDRNGNRVNYQTGSIIWGQPGTNSQHAFFQLIHQGTKLIPADFIGFAESLYGNKQHHNKLMSNFFAQTEALLNGKTYKEAENELRAQNNTDDVVKKLAPFKVFEGNKPTNTIFINKLTPQSLGKLIALYEHKIFVEGVVLNIFSFDQFGVELGKQLSNKILDDLSSSKINNHDVSTLQLIDKFSKSIS